MVIGKIKPTATIVAQFAAGVEVEAIQHEGKMYLPVVGMGEFSTKEDAPARPAAPAPSKPAPAKEEAEESKSYTKEELMEMESKELVKICKDEFGINPDDFDGKNTNKKLRDLILDAQKNGGAKKGDAEDDENEDEKPAPKRPSKKPAKEEADDENDGELADQVAEILEDFDAGKKNKKKAISAICGLVDDADEDKVTELVEKFEDDADADLDEMAEEIAKVLNGEEEKPAPKKGPARKGGKKKEDEDLVAPEDLEVGDRVSVWWDDDNQEWYDGEVKSIKKGKVTIAYDDGTEDNIDPEVHTKIKKLAE